MLWCCFPLILSLLASILLIFRLLSQSSSLENRSLLWLFIAFHELFSFVTTSCYRCTFDMTTFLFPFISFLMKGYEFVVRNYTNRLSHFPWLSLPSFLFTFFIMLFLKGFWIISLLLLFLISTLNYIFLLIWIFFPILLWKPIFLILLFLKKFRIKNMVLLFIMPLYHTILTIHW